MTDELTIDGEQFISSKRASELSGYEQDYIGQLCRGGNILARRVGGLWYVSVGSITKYKERAIEYKPDPPARNDSKSHPDSLLSFDGKGYVSASRAAKITGYSPDYVGQMARAGTIPSRQVGNRWYVDTAEVIKHKEAKDALLAAVQVQSVGLNAQPAGGIESNEESSVDSSLLQYTQDERELMPSIEPRADEKAGNSEDIEKKENEEHIIPIRIYHGGHEAIKSQTPRRNVSLEPRHSMLPMLLPVGLFTIVIVLSLGFVSLKRSSTYTANTNGGKNRSEQLASAGAAMIGKIGDFLEELIVPELVYRRGG